VENKPHKKSFTGEVRLVWGGRHETDLFWFKEMRANKGMRETMFTINLIRETLFNNGLQVLVKSPLYAK